MKHVLIHCLEVFQMKDHEFSNVGIAKATGLNRRTVERNVKELAAHKVLKKCGTKHFASQDYRPSIIYYFYFDAFKGFLEVNDKMATSRIHHACCDETEFETPYKKVVNDTVNDKSKRQGMPLEEGTVQEGTYKNKESTNCTVSNFGFDSDSNYIPLNGASNPTNYISGTLSSTPSSTPSGNNSLDKGLDTVPHTFQRATGQNETLGEKKSNNNNPMTIQDLDNHFDHLSSKQDSSRAVTAQKRINPVTKIEQPDHISEMIEYRKKKDAEAKSIADYVPFSVSQVTKEQVDYDAFFKD